ncbi:cytochrome P450 [Spirosoma sp. KUDC1026]|uniref:cytochrome P450 n=1 Tax=Spirosoma sp. KUDC1026 TaxID=2745947 RepID=UPI00159BD147|nr:cytochrome P450 [Spirosoma sp. KUDC1026]QKZ12426.1 cytochrome P450 [Spirosoma sp. KUDC1026]
MNTVSPVTRPIPVHPGLPLVGNSLEYLRDPLAFMRRLLHQYSDERIVQINVGGRVTHLMLKPEETKQVLQENNRNYGRGKSFAILRAFLGEGLLTSEGDFWRRQRRLAQPAFHRQKLALLANTMIDEAVTWVDRLAKLDRTKPVNISAATTDATLRIVTKTLFGAGLGPELDQISTALNNLNFIANRRVLNPFKLPKWIPSPDNQAFDKAYQTVDSLIYGIVDERRQTGANHDDLLDMYLRATDEETGEGMSNKQLRDEMVTLFVAGYETTATSLAWTLHLLSLHPDILTKAKVEIKQVLDGRDRPSPDDLRSLPYLSQIINESLRLYPPAWIMSRLSFGPDQLGDHRLNSDQGVLLCPYVLHHDPASWPNPEQFNPDRFAGDWSKDKHPYAFLPFGAGPRLCIGNQFALMEMHAILATLLSRFSVRPASTTSVGTRPLITLRSKRPIQLFLEGN